MNLERSAPGTISTTAPRRLRRVGSSLAAVAVIATTSVFVVADAPQVGASPAPVMTGYVPLPADAMQAVMESVSTSADTTLDFTVGITNAGDGAVLYYDDWEDGFEADLTAPVQSTTKVWGDGNTGNGNAATVCSSCAGDLLTSGDVFVLRNTITTPRNSSQIRYDGRDKVASTRGFAITAGGFSTPLGSVLAASASSYDTSKYGTDYIAPVGEDTPTPSGTTPAFETSSLVIMAAEDGTTVQVDSDADGTVDTTDTIDEGEVTFINGGVNEGARVTSDKPVQVHEGTGDVASAYESRWFTLFPTQLLSSDYLNPVASAVNNQRTITYLYNPSGSTITVTPSCTSCSGTISIAAGASQSFASPLGQAVRFDSGGTDFVAVGASGAQSGAAPGSSGDGSSTYDWGFGLVPTNLLTTQAVLGWAPGNSANPPSSGGAGHEDDDPVWVTTLTATTIHVDYDGDPATGALSTPDCFGSHDLEITVGALESTTIIDPNDADMTGARVYTCDGTKVAGAWGEDPGAAPSGSPGFDAGYAIIPSTSMIVEKTAGIATDANADGRIGPGDTVTYDIAIADAGSLAFTNVHGSDLLPAGITYVAGSTTIDDGSTVSPIADDVVPAATTTFPLDEAGLDLPGITAGATVHLRYRATIDDPFPNNTASVTNTAAVTADEASGGDVLTTPLATADLSLAKSITTPAVHVGDNAVFRLTVGNAGPHAATGVEVTDLLPAGATYVSSSASSGTYDDGTGVWAVGTVANGASATLDITATITSASVTNTAEITASQAVDPDSTPGNGPNAEDDRASVGLSVTGPSLGDNVWYDANGNGSRDFGETGLAGVGITATWAGPDNTIGSGGDDHDYTATTDSVGDWSITNLPTGVYRVAVTTGSLPNGIDSPTHDLDGTGTASTTGLTLSAGSGRTDVDFGYTGRGTLGDTVFEDLDAGGTPGAGEGISGITITVTWFGPDGVSGGGDDVTTTDVTDGSGNWSATTLPAGNFRVQVDTAGLPAGYTNTVDPDGGTASRSAVTLTAGATNTAQDFGYRGSGTIGDTVWSDTDGDGTLDAGEPGLGGVAVALLKDTDNNGSFETAVATTVTAGTGSYSFTGLSAGSYSVVVTGPTGQTATTATTRTVTLANAASDLTVDVGFEPPAPPDGAAIGDRVWDDTNGNGLQDTGEPGLGGVTVTLLSDSDANGSFDHTVTSITTSSDGSYQFANLPPASYRVVVTVPGGRTATTPTAITVAPAAGEAVTDADVGLRSGTVAPGTIGDRVWDDTDADGTQDGGETGVAGVTVTLRSDSDGDGTYDATTATTTTAGDGSYSFTGLAPGSYQVVVTIPGGQSATTSPIVPVTLVAGQTVTTADVGLRSTPAATGAIGDRVWSDTDRDQTQDSGEPGLNGVTVSLRTDPDGDGVFDTVAATTTTAGDGNYSFTGLAPGRYLVTIASPTNQAPTSSPDIRVDLAAGQTVTDADVGMATPVTMPYDLRVTTGIEGTPRVGDQVVVRIDVRNGGPADSPTDITVVEVLPLGLTYVGVDAPGWTCTAAGQTITCVLAAGLVNGASSTIGIRATVGGTAGTTLTTAATVSAARVEITLANNTASAPVEVLGASVTATTTTTTTPAAPTAGTSPLALSGGEAVGGLLLGLGLVAVGMGLLISRGRPARPVGSRN